MGTLHKASQLQMEASRTGFNKADLHAITLRLLRADAQAEPNPARARSHFTTNQLETECE